MDRWAGDIVSQFDYINKTYNLKVKRGMKVTVDGNHGKVTSAKGPYINVKFDHLGIHKPRPCHPTWRVEYNAE